MKMIQVGQPKSIKQREGRCFHSEKKMRFSFSPERVAIDPAMGLPPPDERRSIVLKTLGQSLAGIRRSREDILADSL
jgi:hypothetical protein